MEVEVRKFIGVLGILVGTVMIVGTLYSGYKGKSIQEDAINKITEIYSGSSNIEEMDVETFEIVENAVGVLNIPSINVKSAIMSGVDQGTLKYYVGHFPESALPGELGNFSIIGHNNNVHNKVFNDLSKLTNGDLIEVITKEGTYKYSVTDKFVVYPSETYVLDWNGKDKEITVITCTNDSKKRTVIKGVLLE